MGDAVRRSVVLRELAERFPKLRPRMELERDQFGQAVDWQWPGRYGYAYAYDDSRMGVVVEARKVAGALRRQSRWEILQDGDFETTFLVPDTAFPEVARRIRLKQRRELSAKQAAHLRDLHEKLRDRSAGSTSGAENARKQPGPMEVPAAVG